MALVYIIDRVLPVVLMNVQYIWSPVLKTDTKTDIAKITIMHMKTLSLPCAP